ncbi:MAG: hypothetical protein PHO27_12020 [Sulfuricurvum sp.]|jgi:hypothetical protein|nr:hypothetical protein [Sulfuricurvum sp.]
MMNITEHLQVSLVLDALASCAIEGNELAEQLLALEKTDPEQFVKMLYKLGFIKEGE